jgi:UDP-glucose 4-epimerase
MSQRLAKVVVTGGAGFIGSHLVDRLLADTRADVVVLDNMYRGKADNLAQHAHSPRLRIAQGDVRNAELVDTAVRGADVVFHLAAQSTTMGALADAEYSFATNAFGTFNVLSAAARYAVSNVVFTSSSEVYGEPIELPVDETQPLQAVTLYGASKVVGEAYCRAYRRSYGLNTVILRLANTYGPRDFGRLIPLWLGQALQGDVLTVLGGNQLLDFVWVGDVVESLMRAAKLEEPTPAINIGSGIGTRMLDLARRIQSITGGRSEIKMVPARTVDVSQYIGAVDRMRQILGVEPTADPLRHLPELAHLVRLEQLAVA